MTRRVMVAIAAVAMLWPAFVPARADAASGDPVQGIRCDRMEGAAFHIHQHVAIFDHGKPVAIPEDVGRPIVAQCFYWLHTHTPDGIVHIESPTVRTFHLGDFFAIWGQPLTATRVASAKLKPGEQISVWVDGIAYAGNPSKVELANHTDVTIDVGPPARKPAPFNAWGDL